MQVIYMQYWTPYDFQKFRELLRNFWESYGVQGIKLQRSIADILDIFGFPEEEN